MTEMAEARQQKNSQRGSLRRQKGWFGFVHGYKERVKVFDKIWDKINWEKDPNKSGAKSVESDGKGKTVYTF